MFAAFKNPVAFKNLSPLGCLEVYETSLNSMHLQTSDLYEECGAGISLNSFSSMLQLFSSSAQVQSKIQLRKPGMRYLSGHKGESRLRVSRAGGTATVYLGPPAFPSSPVTSIHSVPGHPLTMLIKIGKDGVLLLMWHCLKCIWVQAEVKRCGWRLIVLPLTAGQN